MKSFLANSSLAGPHVDDLATWRPTAVWLDAFLVVIDKPSGLLSVPGRGEANADNLVAQGAHHLARRAERPSFGPRHVGPDRDGPRSRHAS
ncbi:MAG: hypothetical protein QM811_19365 [Pirellulales bacterium]